MKDTLFQTIMKPISKQLMDECISRYDSDYHYEKFKTKEHLQTMLYAHINEVKSLRTLEVSINSQKIGLKYPIKRSTLSAANQNRPAECFLWLAEKLMSLLPRKKHQELKKVVRLLDSTPIQLKGNGFNEWAKQYATNRTQGLKLHIEYDLTLKSSCKMAISNPNYNDCSMGQNWELFSKTIYVFDKGYYDYNWWWSIHKKNAYFVTRLKHNAGISMKTTYKCSDETILEDGTFVLKNKNPRGGKKNLYKDELRRIVIHREGKNPLVLVSNLFDVSAKQISDLYRARWQIELFFKWIKQNLKVKTFLGKNRNAVIIQLATAIIAYLLLYIFKVLSNNAQSMRLFITWVRYNLHNKIRLEKASSYYNQYMKGPPLQKGRGGAFL